MSHKGISIGGRISKSHDKCCYDDNCRFVVKDLEIYEVSVIDMPPKPQKTVLIKRVVL